MNRNKAIALLIRSDTQHTFVPLSFYFKRSLSKIKNIFVQIYVKIFITKFKHGHARGKMSQ